MQTDYEFRNHAGKSLGSFTSFANIVNPTENECILVTRIKITFYIYHSFNFSYRCLTFHIMATLYRFTIVIASSILFYLSQCSKSECRHEFHIQFHKNGQIYEKPIAILNSNIFAAQKMKWYYFRICLTWDCIA